MGCLAARAANPRFGLDARGGRRRIGQCAALRGDPADTLSSESGLGVLDAAREYLNTFFVRVIGGRLATA